jgi:hypothetical protein
MLAFADDGQLVGPEAITFARCCMERLHGAHPSAGTIAVCPGSAQSPLQSSERTRGAPARPAAQMMMRSVRVNDGDDSSRMNAQAQLRALRAVRPRRRPHGRAHAPPVLRAHARPLLGDRRHRAHALAQLSSCFPRAPPPPRQARSPAGRSPRRCAPAACRGRPFVRPAPSRRTVERHRRVVELTRPNLAEGLEQGQRPKLRTRTHVRPRGLSRSVRTAASTAGTPWKSVPARSRVPVHS